MNPRTAVRLFFDLVILITLVLLYNKRAISMAWHEISGLVLFAFIAVHLIINRTWISAITARISSGKLPARTLLSYAISFGAFIAFLLVAISGIALSRVVFGIHSNLAVWKIMHKTGAAVALALVGVHLGLHYDFITSMLAQWFAVPEKARSILHELQLVKPVLNIPRGIRTLLKNTFIVIALAGGAVSFATSPFLGWLALPFVTRPAKPTTPPQPPATVIAAAPQATAAERPVRQQQRIRARDGSGQGTGQNTAQTGEQGAGYGNTAQIRARQGAVQGNKGKVRDQPGLATILKTLGQYTSITLTIAIITAFIDVALRKIREKRATS